MKNKTIIFYDYESTSVARDADPISLGLLAVTEIPVEQTWNEDTNSKTGWSSDGSWYSSINGDFIMEGNDGSIINIKFDKYYNPIKGSYRIIKSFYSEFTDYNIDKCSDWVKENVISKLCLYEGMKDFNLDLYKDLTVFKGANDIISHNLKHWLSQFEDVCFIADFDVIDKPMLIDLIADWDYNTIQHWGESSPPVLLGERKYKIGLPKYPTNIRYDQFFDLHTMFWLKGIDTDISREEFAGITNNNKHNSLADAYTAWECYKKLMKI